MRSSALRKQATLHEANLHKADLHDDSPIHEDFLSAGEPKSATSPGTEAPSVTPSGKAVSADRKAIARAAEEGCHLQGNDNGPDLDLFEDKYHISGFA